MTDGAKKATVEEQLTELREKLRTTDAKERVDRAVAAVAIVISIVSGVASAVFSSSAIDLQRRATALEHADAERAAELEHDGTSLETARMVSDGYLALRTRFDAWHDDPLVTSHRRAARHATEVGCADRSPGCSLCYLRRNPPTFHDGHAAADMEPLDVAGSIRQYWIIARDEWYLTAGLNNADLRQLWTGFFEPAVATTASRPEYRDVFCEMELEGSLLYTTLAGPGEAFRAAVRATAAARPTDASDHSIHCHTEPVFPALDRGLPAAACSFAPGEPGAPYARTTAP